MRLRLGKAETVSPRLGKEAQLLIDKTQKSSVTTEVILEPEVMAPVSQGQRLGTMTIKAGEQILSEVPLVAAEGVERKGWGDIFVDLLRRAAMAKPRV